MSAEKVERRKTLGLTIIIAGVVVFAAIVVASALVAKKRGPREDFLARLPEEKPRPPEPAVVTEDDGAPEEGPRPAELIARARRGVDTALGSAENPGRRALECRLRRRSTGRRKAWRS